eukprot:SAG25_NODE_43_length_19261_cov_111.931218_12_plen_79_part_00
MMEHPLAAPLRRGYALGPGGYARASAASLLGAGAEMCKVRVGASTRGSTRLDDEEVLGPTALVLRTYARTAVGSYVWP